MVKGRVTKLNAWKGKSVGFFVGIDGVDYMYLGDPGIRIGDIIQFEKGKPARDGKPVIKTIVSVESPTTVSPPIDPDKTDSADRGDIITRLACIKAAGYLMQGTGREEDAIRAARRFEKYAKEGS